MHELGTRWAGMDAAQQLEYAPAPVAPAAPAAVTPARAIQMPWPYVSDEFYPICEESLLDLPHRVSHLDKQWRKRIGDAVVKPQARITAPTEATCEEVWGPGHCAEDIKKEIKDHIDSS